MIFFEQNVTCADVTTPYRLIKCVNGEWKGSVCYPPAARHLHYFISRLQAAKPIHHIHDNFPRHLRHWDWFRNDSRKGVKRRPLEASIFLKLFSYFLASSPNCRSVIVQKWKRICLAGSTFYWRQSHAIGGSATSHDSQRPFTPSYQIIPDDRMGTSLQQNTLSPGASHRPSLPVRQQPLPKPALKVSSTIPEE